MEHRYTAIVLGRREVGETDRIYTLYTREQGKVRAIARGVRKPTAKLAGSLETLMIARLTVINGRGTGKIAGAVAEEPFLSLRTDFEALTRSLRAFHYLERLVDLGEPDERLYLLGREYLEIADVLAGLKAGGASRLITEAFLLQAFSELGYHIEAHRDAGTGGPLASGGTYLFSPSAGGVMDAGTGSDPAAVPVSENTVKLLRLILSNRLRSCAKIKASERELRELERLTERFYRWIAP